MHFETTVYLPIKITRLGPNSKVNRVMIGKILDQIQGQFEDARTTIEYSGSPDYYPYTENLNTGEVIRHEYGV